MNEDLLQDLVLYRKSHEKAVSTAARSLMTLFREICPSLLVKKDRGRPTNPKARPKAFGEVSVASDVPGLELLQEDDDDSMHSSSDDELDNCREEKIGKEEEEEGDEEEEKASVENDDEEVNFDEEHDVGGSDDDDDLEDVNDTDDDDEVDSDADIDDNLDIDDDLEIDDTGNSDDDRSDEEKEVKLKGEKRKFSDYVGQLSAADSSLRALKRLAGGKTTVIPSDSAGGILSNEDFQRIKELKAKKEAEQAMNQHGLNKKGSDPKAYKIPSSEQLSTKRVDPAILESICSGDDYETVGNEEHVEEPYVKSEVWDTWKQ